MNRWHGGRTARPQLLSASRGQEGEDTNSSRGNARNDSEGSHVLGTSSQGQRGGVSELGLLGRETEFNQSSGDGQTGSRVHLEKQSVSGSRGTA